MLYDDFMAQDKLNFFEWYAHREASFIKGDTPHTGFIEGFAKDGAWRSYNKDEPNHCGDCTDWPVSCSLCALEGLLREYRMYFFDKRDSGEEVYFPGEGFIGGEE